MDWHASQDGLEDPIDKEGKETGRRDPCICREVVGEMGEAWPDSCDTISKEITSLYTEDGSPHSCNESAETDCWVAAVHPEDGPDDDGEGYGIRRAHLASQRDDHGADGKAEEDNWDGLSSSEAERHDRADRGGQWRSEHVATPICPVVLVRNIRTGRCNDESNLQCRPKFSAPVELGLSPCLTILDCFHTDLLEMVHAMRGEEQSLPLNAWAR